ncbi:DUF4352 domain-containing protein [Hyalangium sp.]|uniref:DUF4352 domain-containing protein n=1 Tax=Hyalangium sp. TaxID=2028555 RepID=UPI002D41EF6B|nr:DUF4352 domain-containing protein [Hyalangium sp.]HYH98205.1 DUF4352 domain-containing protein [Hyalangium sp.]
MSGRPSLSPMLLVAALAWGCTKNEAPPQQEDRTLAKLRAEADRVGKGGAPSGPPQTQAPEEPNAGLADLATADEGASERKLKLPEPNDTKHVDTVAVKLTGLKSSHSVKGGKLSLTSEELFLRVQLVMQNVGKAPAPVTLEGARLVDPAGKEYAVARDAQITAGTRELRHTWGPDERSDVVLFFEIPSSAVEEGLTLVLPATSGEVRLALR